MLPEEPWSCTRWVKPLGYSVLVTAAAGISSHLLPAAWSANVVGALFFAATYFLVLRHDSNTIRDHGLGLGGLFEPTPLSAARMLRDTGRATSWALATAALTLPPFLLGYRLWWQPSRSFSYDLAGLPLQDMVTQIVAVALPEEMFYRGYVQTELTPRTKPAAGPGEKLPILPIVVTSFIFAVGHVVTVPHPARLAVFFPSLVFGWLRARCGGIGPSVLYHALCNVFTLYLGRGYGFFA